MAMTKGVSVSSLVVGISLLVLTLISFICGCVAIGVITTTARVSVGLWGLYFAVPGIISIVAGYKKLKALLAIALGTHILGIILGIAGAIVASFLWHVTAATCFNSYLSGHCTCSYGGTAYEYPADCKDLDTVRACSAAVTIIFILATIVCFIGSIQGCVGTCCAPPEQQTVIVTTAQQPTTVVMVPQGQPAYSQQPQPVFSQQPPPYGQNGAQVVDTKA